MSADTCRELRSRSLHDKDRAFVGGCGWRSQLIAMRASGSRSAIYLKSNLSDCYTEPFSETKHSLGNGEVDSSMLSGSAIPPRGIRHFEHGISATCPVDRTAVAPCRSDVSGHVKPFTFLRYDMHYDYLRSFDHLPAYRRMAVEAHFGTAKDRPDLLRRDQSIDLTFGCDNIDQPPFLHNFLLE